MGVTVTDSGLLDVIEPAQRHAVRVVQTFLRAYNSRDGQGLFTGPARYHVLEDRLRIAAVQSRSLVELTSNLMRSMRWPSPPRALDDEWIAMMTGDDQLRVITVLQRDTGVVVMLARHLLREEVTA